MLVIGDGCVILDERGDDALLVWPSDRTSWNAETGDVTFESTSGEIVELVDGDTVSFGGGGTSEQEGGLPPDEFLASIDWVSEPAISCVTDTRWFVGDYVEPSADGGADAGRLR